MDGSTCVGMYTHTYTVLVHLMYVGLSCVHLYCRYALQLNSLSMIMHMQSV